MPFFSLCIAQISGSLLWRTSGREAGVLTRDSLLNNLSLQVLRWRSAVCYSRPRGCARLPPPPMAQEAAAKCSGPPTNELITPPTSEEECGGRGGGEAD